MKTHRLGLCALLAAAGLAHGQSFLEPFDDVPGLAGNGWFIQNNSTPIGIFSWDTGNTLQFPPQASTGYIAANYQSGSGVATISNWLLTPSRTFQNGHTITFWTRTLSAVSYPDRLQVRMSTSGPGTNVGAVGDPAAVGDFTTLLLDINPTYTATGYPTTWTQYTIVLSGLPAAGATGRVAFRYFVENGGPDGARSDYIGIDQFEYTAGAIVSGGCCLPDGSCAVITSASCASQGGAYRGNGTDCSGANCPQPGACCFTDGTCTVAAAAQCAAASGVYSGNGTACGNCPQPFGSWGEQGDAGDLPATANIITGGGPLNTIVGQISDASDADMYKFQLCNPAAFSASTVTEPGTLADSQLFLFNAAGLGVAFDDDDPAMSGTLSVLSSAFTASLSPGVCYLAISGWDRDPVDASTAELWADTPYAVERAPDGPGAANPVAAWNGGGTTGTYTITLTGACKLPVPVTCYANCDHSTQQPCLNVLDFNCFLNAFAAGASYANCDASTTVPVLNVLDFNCFLNRFAAGCSGC